MSSLPSPQTERDRLEKQLREKLNAAEEAYYAASEEHEKIRNEFIDMLDHPDGAHAVRQAAKRERVALENYGHALKAFSDLVNDRCPSDDPRS